MTVKKKILATDSVKAIEEFLSKGAEVRQEMVTSKDMRKKIAICLSVPAALLEELDQHLRCQVGLKRTGWILQAMKEKLDREMGHIVQ
jgi:hypothetical protein